MKMYKNNYNESFEFEAQKRFRNHHRFLIKKNVYSLK